MKSAAHGLLAAGRVGTGDADLGRNTLAVVVVHALARFAVHLNGFASASVSAGICHAVTFSFLEAAATCLVCHVGCIAGYKDVAFGTQLLFIVDTCDC